MSVISRIFRRKSAGDAVGSELREQLETWGWSGSGMPVNAFTAMQHTAVLACVSILSEDVAKLPVRVYRRTKDGGKAPVPDHPLDRLLRRPNAWQTRFEFMEMMQAALVLRGNAYAPILRNFRGEPIGLIPVHPDRVTLYEAPTGEYFFLVARNGLHETAVLREFDLLIPAEDMLHVRWLSTWNSLLGVSRIQLMRESVGLSMAQEQHMARFAGQGARPSGVLQTDVILSDEAYNKLRTSWAETQTGWKNAGKPAILEQGLKWQSLGLSLADSQFLESRRFSLEDIARGFRVPLHKLGMPGTSDSKALVQSDQGYLNDVISSYCDRWALKLENTFGLDGDEIFVEYDYEHFLRADLLTRITAKRAGVMGAIYSPNEARRGEGLADVPGGDTVMQPTNMAPLGWVPPSPGGAQGSEQTGTAADGGDGDATHLPDEGPAPNA